MFGLVQTIVGGLSAFSKIEQACANGENIICPYCGDEMRISFGCSESYGGPEGYTCTNHYDLGCNTPDCPNNYYAGKTRNNTDFQTIKFDSAEAREQYFTQIKAKVKVLRIREKQAHFKLSKKRAGKTQYCEICSHAIPEGSQNMVQPSVKLGYRCYERAHYICLECWNHHILGQNLL